MLDRAHLFQFLLYPVEAISQDAGIDRLLEALAGLELPLMSVEHLLLHQREEIHHWAVFVGLFKGENILWLVG